MSSTHNSRAADYDMDIIKVLQDIFGKDIDAVQNDLSAIYSRYFMDETDGVGFLRFLFAQYMLTLVELVGVDNFQTALMDQGIYALTMKDQPDG